jgi:glycosyltransferase involved in cell wall biosynthesis
MTSINISFIVPVYNRPEEIDELLKSFINLDGNFDFEIVIIEDGSADCSDVIISKYIDDLNISYFKKNNTGPGDSRNRGMKLATGDYYIILDSDCILPNNYLINFFQNINKKYVDCFGGVDDSHHSFTNFQKAVNFTMTSFITTGGIRGGGLKNKNFQARSFNMGISKKAFELTRGFGDIHPGEDPDLSLRISKLGLSSKLYNDVKVFHKRRVNVRAFFNQVYKFGMVRPIINKWHPKSNNIIFWFPSFFLFYMILSVLLIPFNFMYPLITIIFYIALIFISSLILNKSLTVALFSIFTTLIQFIGYGCGFVKSNLILLFSNKNTEDAFPSYFFKNQTK